MRHFAIVPYGPFRTSEGAWVNIAVHTGAQWKRFCESVLRRPELTEDPRFATNQLRLEHRESLEPLIEAALGGRGHGSLRRDLEAADIPYGAINDVRGLLEHPQLKARRKWITVRAPSGPIRAFAHPLNVENVRPNRGAVPALDQHGDELRFAATHGSLP